MKRVGLLFAGCALAGLVVGAIWPPPPVPSNRDSADSWTLPPQDRLARYSQEAFDQATRGTRWQGDADGAAASPESGPTQWRLVGLTESPEARALVIEVGKDRQASRLEPGDALPDGGRLISIEGDTVTVELDNCRRVHQVHYRQPIRSSGDCDAGTMPRTERVP